MLNINRLFKRIYWKFYPVSDDRCLLFLQKKNWIKLYPKVESIDETIEKLITKRISISRFGDGEFLLALSRNIDFQKSNKEISQRLRKIMKSNSEFCLIGIVEFTTEGLTNYSLRFWFENINDLIPLFTKRIYSNAGLTRNSSLDQILMLKNVWNDRNVIFVTGEGSRLDIDHELFDNIRTKQIFYTLAKDCWTHYDKIINEVVSICNSIDTPLVYCSLGPTASVLAFDLSEKGIQCLDLGHLTNVFDQLKYKSPIPEELAFT